MALTSKNLIQNLLEITHDNINIAENFKNKPVNILNWKQHSDSWSILECIEHLNRYGDFYIPEITNKIKTAKHNSSEIFKSNWLGKYFSKSVSYNENLNKMKTFTSMNPKGSRLNIEVLNKFLTQQQQIIELLNAATEINLDKTKTAISISKLIKLKLGDTFRVLIFHNQRHLKQAEKALINASK